MTYFRFLPLCLSFIFFADISAFNFPCSFHNSKPLGNDYAEDYAIPDREDYNWPNNEVPYVFDENTSTKDQVVIKEQMDVIETNAPCIKFIEKTKRTAPRKHLRIIVHNKNSCNHTVTSRGSRWSISGLGGEVNNHNRPRIDFISYSRLSDCDIEQYLKKVRGLVIHELMHVFGIPHTQKRSDRVNYIEVDENCILNNTVAREQYEIIKNYPNKTVMAEVPYRCDSVMHYGPKTLSKGTYGNECPTMKSKHKDCVFREDRVLPEDWMMLRIQVGCTDSAIGSSKSTTWADPATTTIPTTIPRDCPYTNVHDDYCDKYARAGYCNSWWMEKDCAKSCGC